MIAAYGQDVKYGPITALSKWSADKLTVQEAAHVKNYKALVTCCISLRAGWKDCGLVYQCHKEAVASSNVVRQ